MLIHSKDNIVLAIETTIQDVTYHRNGCSGEGFWTVRFTFTDEDNTTPMRMLATVFNAEDRSAMQVAIVSIEDCAQADKVRGWRGDYFAGDMYDVIDEWKVANWSSYTRRAGAGE
jgi:hypothetical protein